MVMAWRRRNGLRYPYMAVNTIDFFHISTEERNDLGDFCATHGVDEFRVRPDESGQLGQYDPVTPRQSPSKCHWPWISMSIDCDGSVYACPIAFEQRISYGNLSTSSFEEIWNNDLYVTTRTYLARNAEHCEGLPKLPCFNCRWYGKNNVQTTDEVEQSLPA